MKLFEGFGKVKIDEVKELKDKNRMLESKVRDLEFNLSILKIQLNNEIGKRQINELMELNAKKGENLKKMIGILEEIRKINDKNTKSEGI